jgi:ribosomal protein S18 acetylase RimI-like enzyme
MSTPPTPATPSASESGSGARLELHLVRPEELEDVGRLTTEVYIGEGYIEESDGYVLELVDTPRRAREAEVWVAVEDGTLLGSVTFCPTGSAYREIAHDDEGEFRMLAVSPSARGRGVGRELVAQCLRRSRELGYAGVRMSTMDRMTSAHSVYEALGFIRAPEDDWSPEPRVNLLAYAVRLETAD